MTLRCFGDGCKCILPTPVLERFLAASSSLLTMKSLMLKSFCEVEGFIQCPEPKCTNVLVGSRLEVAVTCPACGKGIPLSFFGCMPLIDSMCFLWLFCYVQEQTFAPGVVQDHTNQ